MNFNTLADFFAGQPDDVMSPAIRGMAESDSEDGEVDIYVGEMEQVYETELQPVYETDDEGNLVYDDNDEPIPLEDDQGNVIYEEQTVLDEDGNPVPVLDEQGNPVFEKVQLVDCDGEPIVEYDADGNPIAQTDEHGDPIYIEDEGGNPLPVLDENDEPVYIYDEDGDPVPLYQVLPVEESQVVTIGTVGAVRAGETPVVSMGLGGAAAIASNGWGDRVEVAIDNAATIASEAAEVAEATNQHFFSDTSGIHVTENESDATTGHNILINSLGILLRSALANLVSITRSAIAFFDGNGNNAGNVVAQFGASGAQVGKASESHLSMDYHSLSLVDKDGNTYLHVSDPRDTSGTAAVTDRWTGDGARTSYSLTFHATGTSYTVKVGGVAASASKTDTGFDLATAAPSGSEVIAEYETEDALAAFAFGKRMPNSTVGAYSMTEGVMTAASGHASHAEGQFTSATGTSSHAEGNMSTASGHNSHAEGWYADAGGQNSHAEGSVTHATGFASHAEGAESVASGNTSHAQNSGTVAQGRSQTAMGRYNVADANDEYALIIGNGTSDSSRSNALTVDWDGNVKTSGHLMSILSYGHSTWNDFLEAYNTNSVVYCRASSNSNPASGAQTRLAFMAYVNADPPTNVEFQYYRSVSSHTASQQGDQVYVYKLTNTGTWSVTVREASVKVAAGDGLDMAYASGTATLSLGSEVGSRVTKDQSTAVSLTSGTWGEVCNVSLDAGTWVVHGNVQHASNATGRRGACLSTEASAPTTGDLRQRGLQVPPVSGAATMLNTCITVKLSAATTMRLYGLQTSGATNNATGCITAVRIV